MTQAFLNRFQYGDYQTLGFLYLVKGRNKVFECCTLELPWKNNQDRVSCIPEGKYLVNPRAAEDSGDFDYDHYIIESVQGRSYILFHIANYKSDLLGCIGVGSDFAYVNDDKYVDITNSTGTFNGMKSIIGRNPFKLIISGVYYDAETA